MEMMKRVLLEGTNQSLFYTQPSDLTVLTFEKNLVQKCTRKPRESSSHEMSSLASLRSTVFGGQV